MNNMTSDTEYEYTAYGSDKNKIIVAGGGLGNGNTCANVERIQNKWYYCEYGKNPQKQYIGSHIEFDEEGYEFNITHEEPDENDEHFACEDSDDEDAEDTE